MVEGIHKSVVRWTSEQLPSVNKLFIGLATGLLTLLLMVGPAAATCLYQGVPYSEGARVCMHRTMFMCRGKRWVRTAERCWERYANQAEPQRSAVHAQRKLVELEIHPCCSKP